MVTAIGGSGLAAGLVVGGVSAARHGEAADEPRAMEALALQEEAEGLETAAVVTITAGGVVAAVGLIWGIVDHTTADSIGFDRRGLRLRF